MRSISKISGEYISIMDKANRRVVNEQIFIYAISGEGKGLAMEGLAEEFHKHGYVVIGIADPKRKWELAFQMFEPREYWHLQHLRKIGKIPKEKKVKLYHPFTFSIPQAYLPEINFFSLSLKQIYGNEWNFIAETESEIEAIRILKEMTKNLSKEEGIFSLYNRTENAIVGVERSNRKRTAENFFSKVSLGKKTSLGDIRKYFNPFKENYFLTKDSCNLNLDIWKILDDQEHYHIFSARWINDEKVRDFMTLALIELIINEVSHKVPKHPILFLIPEINHFCPERSLGYKAILNQFMNGKLGMFRAQGRGISTISDAQVWSDIDPKTRDKATVTLFGKIGGGTDLDRIKKSYSYQRPIVEELKDPTHKNTFIFSDKKQVSPKLMFFSSSAHAEAHEDFFERYKKSGKPMKRYSEVIEYMRGVYKEDVQRVAMIVEKEEKTDAKIKLQEKLEKENKSEDKIKKEKDRIKVRESETKVKIMRLCYEMFHNDSIPKSERSYRKIAKVHGVSHPVVKKYILEYEKILEDEKEKSSV